MIITLIDIMTGETVQLETTYSAAELKECSILDIIEDVEDIFEDDMHYDFYINDEKLSIDDMHLFVENDDILLIMQKPAGGVFTAAALIKALAGMALSFVLNWVATALFGPKENKYEDTRTDSSYALNNQQNSSDIGEYAGVGYGKFRLYPKVINQPFVWYFQHDMYMGRCLAIGQGDYSIDKFQIGSQEITATEPNVKWELFKSQGRTWDSISEGMAFNTLTRTALTGATNKDVLNKTVTLTPPAKTQSVDVTIELQHDLPRAFIITLSAYKGTTLLKTYQTGETVDGWKPSTSVIVGVEAPGMNRITVHVAGDKASVAGGTVSAVIKSGEALVEGTTENFGWTNDVVNALDTVSNERINLPSKDFTPTLHKLNANISGISINCEYPSGLWYVDSKGGKHTIDNDIKVQLIGKNGQVVYEKLFTVWSAAKTNPAKDIQDPCRVTFQLKKPAGADWDRVRVVKRAADLNSSKLMKEAHLTAIYELYPNESRNYGNLTAMLIMMKATGQTSGENKINLFATRTDVGNSVKDILTDIYSNTQYGGKLPAKDLMFDPVANQTKVNCYYEENQTVLDAMNVLAKPQLFHLVPKGANIHIKKDVPQSLPVQRYNDDRMSQVSCSYLFDEYKEQYDSVEVEYRDAEWLPATVRYPALGISPQLVKAFGLETKASAETYAKYLYKQEKARRQTVTFNTDIQGRVPEFLDLLELTHTTVSSNGKPKMFQVLKVSSDDNTSTIECINYDAGIFK